MRRLGFFILVVIFFTACSEDSETYNEDTPSRRTILVYMAAENNLAGDAFDKDDINEMCEASKNIGNDCRLIVYHDGPGATPPYICRLKGGELIDSVSLQESLTADPAVLERIIRYTCNKYPATSYGLVLWGHSSGWIIDDRTCDNKNSRRAYGGDTGNGSSSSAGNYWMNIPDMANAIANAMDNQTLAFIVADCCNMGSIEVAYELRKVTEYLIASPAEIPGAGAPYNLVIADLFSTSPDFYRFFIDHYYEYYLQLYPELVKSQPSYSYLSGYSLPLVAVRTSALDDLATITAKLLATIPEKIKPDGELALEGITCYGYTKSYSQGDAFNYDMYQTLKENIDIDEFNLWVPYFRNAVPYCRYSAKWLSEFSSLTNLMQKNTVDANKCASLAMFFPHTQYSNTIPNFNKSIHEYQWASAVQWSNFGWPSE